MTNSPAVSVLMSVRNGMPYIKEAVESILAQTYREWEFVIVDNASGDGTKEYLEDMRRKDPRIRLIRNDVYKEQGEGLNMGLEQCRGVWVMRMDADDISLPDRLERQLDFIKVNPDISVAATLVYYIDENGRVIGKNTSKWTGRISVDKTVENNELVGLPHPSVIMRRDVIKGVGGYRPQFRPAEDIDLWNRVLEKGHRIIVQGEYLLKYRIHSSGSSFSFKKAKSARLKVAWLKDCLARRRSGRDEQSWEEFLASRARMPLLKKLNAERKDYAKALYKYSVLNFSKRSYHRMLPAIMAALIMQPGFVIKQVTSKRWR
ncbi:MAG: glycosyltransferase [Candidatus Omnitrophica bacterium]|nr:glycosyltransferase [Candidatus Omnitrophota bacterium]